MPRKKKFIPKKRKPRKWVGKETRYIRSMVRQGKSTSFINGGLQVIQKSLLKIPPKRLVHDSDPLTQI